MKTIITLFASVIAAMLLLCSCGSKARNSSIENTIKLGTAKIEINVLLLSSNPLRIFSCDQLRIHTNTRSIFEAGQVWHETELNRGISEEGTLFFSEIFL